jgi:hypothetical protein
MSDLNCLGLTETGPRPIFEVKEIARDTVFDDSGFIEPELLELLEPGDVNPDKKVWVVRPWFIAASLVILALGLSFGTVRDLNIRLAGTGTQAPLVEIAGQDAGADNSESEELLDKKDLAGLIGPRPLDSDDPRFLEISGESGRVLFAETTLDPQLQTHSLKWLKRTQAKRAALVVMNPFDGQVLALADYRRDGGETNSALAESFPAASLFKIITAAAAVEKADLQADSEVLYDGGKHTLYKGNVIKKPDEGLHRTTLREGFAESINTVFGKLGAFTLGPDELDDFARRFYFNQPIDFEMPVAVSSFALGNGEDLFHMAELASGFNRVTKATPLHGAMLASAVISGGILYEPTVVTEVFDRDNNVYYKSQPRSLGRVISPDTAAQLSELMQAAVALGTGRRHFSDAEKHPLLSGLVIGGKSGTINDEEGLRVEWFVAYSYWPEPGSGAPAWPLALAAVVANDGRAAVDSQEIIRQALLSYYQPLLDGTGRTFR